MISEKDLAEFRALGEDAKDGGYVSVRKDMAIELVAAAEKSERYRLALAKIVEWNTDPITMRRLAKEALQGSESE